jgi:1-deoxy-D-xylulose-5-phosphate reductoisomerase
LLYPERAPNRLQPWNPVETPNLTFEEPDLKTFRCPEIARKSARIGMTAPCAMNAANEEAANAFLKGQCGFLQIADVVEEAVSRHNPVEPTLENLLASDQWARETVRSILKLE